MRFDNFSELKSNGFKGFIPILTLMKDRSIIPDQKGIYLVLYNSNAIPNFMIKGVGGFFKGKNPNVPIKTLENNWVVNTIVIYIGQAGGRGSSQTLRKRISQYLSFGQGNNIGHWGGRLIWQIENYKDLQIAWKVIEKYDPRDIEEELISDFIGLYGKRPYANLAN